MKHIGLPVVLSNYVERSRFLQAKLPKEREAEIPVEAPVVPCYQIMFTPVECQYRQSLDDGQNERPYLYYSNTRAFKPSFMEQYDSFRYLPLCYIRSMMNG